MSVTILPFALYQADILVDIVIAELGIKYPLVHCISAGVDDLPCFLTFYSNQT